MLNYLMKREAAVLIINNPPVNSLNHEVRKSIINGIELAVSKKAKSIILAGEGKMFTGGADVKEFAKGNALLEPNLFNIMDFVEKVEIPVVTCMHGNAVGGGFELALASHWRVGTGDARLGLPEVHLGFIPGIF